MPFRHRIYISILKFLWILPVFTKNKNKNKTTSVVGFSVLNMPRHIQKTTDE